MERERAVMAALDDFQAQVLTMATRIEQIRRSPRATNLLSELEAVSVASTAFEDAVQALEEAYGRIQGAHVAARLQAHGVAA